LELDAQGWGQVEARLNASQENSRITQNLLRHLKELGAKSVLIEEEYLDRDFSEAYSGFYSKLFKRHSKLCFRLLFFSEALAAAMSNEDPKVQATSLEEIGKQGFLGQVILRPIHKAPIAQAVLRPPPSPIGLETHLLVKSPIHVHSTGATFVVQAIPMTQQDQRVGACAQAAIWTCVRHFHFRHSGPWVSMLGVNDAAMARAQWSVSSTIPNGSEFLSLNEMVSALHAVGRKPLTYLAEKQNPPQWTNLRPADVINRYVDSGIPVIVGLQFGRMGHAIVATGQVFANQPQTMPLPAKPTRAEYCAAFLINDDQQGPNLRMPVQPGSPFGETPYSLQQVYFLIIGLPDKVYFPAEKAEELAWDILRDYELEWPDFVKNHANDVGVSVDVGNAFVDDIANNRVIARTYLTYGWKYQYRALRNIMSNDVKRIARATDLPRFVWVTEFGTLTSLAEDIKSRRIFAHCVIDATAKSMGADSRLIFHAPGRAVQQVHDPANPTAAYLRTQFVIRDDGPYYPKRRGISEF
jgi:hypothetical protein